MEETRLYETRRYRCLVYHRILTEELYLTLCGIERCNPGNRVALWRGGYHLHVILSGKGVFCADGRRRELHPGNLFICKPGEETWYEADRDDPWTYCWMTYEGSRAEEICEQAGFVKGVNWLEDTVDTSRFLELVQKVLDHPELTLANDIRRLGILIEFLGYAVEAGQKRSSLPRREWDYTPEQYVNYAREFIHANYDKITVAEIARNIGIHRTYLTSIFTAQTGVSPQEYLLRYRLQRGRDLLEQTNESIQVISERIGYESPFTFSRAFKKRYGMSPSYYRNRSRGRTDPKTAKGFGSETEEEQAGNHQE